MTVTEEKIDERKPLEGRERYVTVRVTVDERYQVKLPIEGVKVFANDETRPDAVRWTVVSARPVQVQIKWETETPFRNTGVAALDAADREWASGALGGREPEFMAALMADGNEGYPGLFRYSVLVTDEKGAVLGGAKPWIKNIAAPVEFD